MVLQTIESQVELLYPHTACAVLSRLCCINDRILWMFKDICSWFQNQVRTRCSHVDFELFLKLKTGNGQNKFRKRPERLPPLLADGPDCVRRLPQDFLHRKHLKMWKKWAGALVHIRTHLKFIEQTNRCSTSEVLFSLRQLSISWCHRWIRPITPPGPLNLGWSHLSAVEHDPTETVWILEPSPAGTFSWIYYSLDGSIKHQITDQ